MRCESGAAILEFALALPILLALVAGCVEIGRALIVYQVMVEAAQGGARSLAHLPDPTCRPACPAAVAETLSGTARQIRENARLSPDRVRVATLLDLPPGTVGLRVEVALDTDLLAPFGLERLLTLRTTRYEAHLAE